MTNTDFKVAGSGEALVRIRTDRPQDWFETTESRVKKVAVLEANWDSYGALPVSRVAAQYALSLVAYLSNYEGVAEPKVTATPDGNVVLHWLDELRSIDVEIDDRGIMEFDVEGSQEVDGRTSDMAKVLEIVTKL